MPNSSRPADQAAVTLRRNQAALRMPAAPLLSVVVPFYTYDVSDLAKRLDALYQGVIEPVDVIFLDDGSPDRRWADQVWEVAQHCSVPMSVGALSSNVGRARIRNHLCHTTDAPYLLYLDADMWPDRDDFLTLYLGWIREGGVDVIYGGRSADKAVLTAPEYSLHRVFTQLREQIPASDRRLAPAYSFYSCNFVVRREILAAIPLNAAYTGWGWEDCEWAMRVAERYAIRHEDNPASHLGLLTCDQILKKYDESVGNFSLFYSAHPEVVAQTMLVKVARLAGALGLSSPLGLFARALARAAWLPNKLRLLGLMLYKSALYAPVVGGRAVANPR
jgi:glycosyltransferase involved in cell wall biosynthesis